MADDEPARHVDAPRETRGIAKLWPDRYYRAPARGPSGPERRGTAFGQRGRLAAVHRGGERLSALYGPLAGFYGEGSADLPRFSCGGGTDSRLIIRLKR